MGDITTGLGLWDAQPLCLAPYSEEMEALLLVVGGGSQASLF